MTATARTAPRNVDDRYLLSISISAPAAQWAAVRAAMEAAQKRCTDSRQAVCGPFIARLDLRVNAAKPIKRGHPGHGVWLNECYVSIDGKVCNWITVAELIMAYGDQDAKALGSVIVPACSQVIYGGRQPEESDGG